MPFSFLPNKDRMFKEMEKWVTQGKADVLKGFCECCEFRVFELILTPECRTCIVRKGILAITDEKDGYVLHKEDLLQVY